jgi:hypothetical protein
MKKLLYISNLLILCYSTNSYAQVGIGTFSPDASAVLELNSSTKGFLPPRMTAYPTSPAIGLTVYRTDLNGYYTWNGTVWSQDVFGVNIYSADGSLSSVRTITMAANNLTFSSTTGNLIFNPSSTGKVGIGTTSPINGFDLKNSLGLPSNTTSAATYTLSSTDVILYLTATSNQTITLPAANTVSGRVYYVVNNTSSSKTISSYNALSGSASTSIAANSALALQSDGISWRAFQNNVAANNIATTYFKSTSTDVSHATWITPWNKLAISDLDIVVPAGKTLFAEYLLLGQTSTVAFPPTNLQARGFSAGDYISGSLMFNHNANVDAGEEIFVFSNDVPDTDASANPARVVDTEYPNTNVQPMMLKIRYKNNSGSSVTFGYSFGGDNNLTSSGTTISILAGSTVVYSIQ